MLSDLLATQYPDTTATVQPTQVCGCGPKPSLLPFMLVMFPEEATSETVIESKCEMKVGPHHSFSPFDRELPTNI